MLWGLFYLGLAGFATRLSWRTPMGGVGLALVVASIATNIVAFSYPFPIRLILEIVLGVYIATAAATGWAHKGGRAYQVVMAIAALDVLFTGAVCLFGSQASDIRLLWEISTNILFGAQCVCVGIPGARNGYDVWVHAVDRRRLMDSGNPDEDILLKRLRRVD